MKNIRILKKRFTKGFLAVGTAGLLLLGGTLAFLTDSDEKVNTFTVGKVDIELQEPSWTPEEYTKITPNEKIVKDPKIINTGINDAFVYMKVYVPMENLITADDQGRRKAQAIQELFTFQTNDGWTLLKSGEEGKAKYYVYAYDSILAPGNETKPLFEEMQFINVVEGQIDGQEFHIPIHAYAIQSDHIGEDTMDVKERAKLAFGKYQNQNKTSEGGK